MNNLTIYVLYDVKAKTIARVFLFKNMEVCLRFLQQNMTQLGVNLIDYELYAVGDIDEEKLILVPERDHENEVMEMRDFNNQICCKEFNDIKKEFFEKIKKEQEKETKNETKIPNFGY